jgi:hypothetical protein
VRSQPIIFSAEMVHALLAGRKTQTRRKVKSKNILMPEPSECYYGQAGDGLWVREVFANNETGIIYKADNPTAAVGWISPIYMPRKASRISLKITEVSIEQVQDISEQDAIAEGLIHAADVQINDIHVSNQYPNRRAYPVIEPSLGSCVDAWQSSKTAPAFLNPIDAYAQLWDSLAKTGYRWDDNPLVWVVKFEVVK